MSKRKKSAQTGNSKRYFLYILTSIAVIGMAFWGSRGKDSEISGSLNLNSIANNNYNLSTDQMSEFYLIANAASSLDLASMDIIGSNYVTVSVMRESGQTSSNVTSLEKPTYMDTSNFAHGVIAYTVKEGDTMQSIATELSEAYSTSISTDQIRWSNGLKTLDISVGQVLYLPSETGIVYTVKSGDSVDSIVKTYGSSVASVIEKNNLTSADSIAAGNRILIPGGTVPVSLRPEYVAPQKRPTSYTYTSTYTYLGNTSARQGLTIIGYNYYGGGECVGYATWYRNVSGLSSLRPVGTMWGNANSWARSAARDGFRVDKTPEVGAVFQTAAGRYGHVGIVVGINDDGSIVVQETNYDHFKGRVTRATIPANIVSSFNYIH